MYKLLLLLLCIHSLLLQQHPLLFVSYPHPQFSGLAKTQRLKPQEEEEEEAPKIMKWKQREQKKKTRNNNAWRVTILSGSVTHYLSQQPLPFKVISFLFSTTSSSTVEAAQEEKESPFRVFKQHQLRSGWRIPTGEWKGAPQPQSKLGYGYICSTWSTP